VKAPRSQNHSGNPASNQRTLAVPRTIVCVPVSFAYPCHLQTDGLSPCRERLCVSPCHLQTVGLSPRRERLCVSLCHFPVSFFIACHPALANCCRLDRRSRAFSTVQNTLDKSIARLSQTGVRPRVHSQQTPGRIWISQAAPPRSSLAQLIRSPLRSSGSAKLPNLES
jgi:hypothetical protein